MAFFLDFLYNDLTASTSWVDELSADLSQVMDEPSKEAERKVATLQGTQEAVEEPQCAIQEAQIAEVDATTREAL